VAVSSSIAHELFQLLNKVGREYTRQIHTIVIEKKSPSLENKKFPAVLNLKII
jgi:hypothetical protein